MKNTLKYMILALAGVMVMTISCQREIIMPDNGVNEGGIELNLSIRVPDMEKVATKAVDPDGGGVQQITVFCFDAYGLFITTAKADVTPGAANNDGYSLTGTFKVTVPAHTETVHLVGNQSLDYFAEGDYEGKSEVEVMTSIQASAGRMIYWARESIAKLVPNATVTLLRNQAKMTVVVADGVGFEEKGWVVVNTSAYGTVAPYNPDTDTFMAPSTSNPFVTSPKNKTRITGFYDVRNETVEYFFETENTDEEPVDVIVKGTQGSTEELYYRISLVDANGDYINLLRNHHYTVNIDGALSYGQTSFEAALTAPATNNVWISISDNVPSIYDENFRLSVDETFVVIGEEEFDDSSDLNTKSLYYTLEKHGTGTISKPDVDWIGENNVASEGFTHNFDTSTGRGELIINLTAMGDEQKREGTLLVKFGHLTRKIKVITVKKQKFEPAWITTNIYGGATGENVTMMFTIPETCPEELFPLDVLVSVNDLDVRNESGMALPIIRAGEPGYGEDNGIGYKYVYTVEEAGIQRLYLETILETDTNTDTNDDGVVDPATINVTIEADHFKSLTKTATIHAAVNRYIRLTNLRSYSATIPADEVIYYYLVPMKLGAIVEFPTYLEEITTEANGNVTTKQIAPGANDEFLLYSKYLDHDDVAGQDFEFHEINKDKWSTGGRVYGFTRTDNGNSEPGKGAIYHMLTNSSRSDEVVRIASNPYDQPSVTGEGNCEGLQYKSAVFELQTFRPFEFSAEVNDVSGPTVQIAYEPGTAVNVEFDVTSFKSAIEGVEDKDQVSVDPFGKEFKIYIDAPMLEIDDSRRGKLTESKFYEESEGRFVYVVDADREAEREYGSATASVTDDATTDYIGNEVEVNQEDERKSLPFKTKDIVSTGEITISSEEDLVVFNKQTFRVLNAPITGSVKYEDSEGNSIDVPAGEFLPFEMLPTYNRIGAITVTADGMYELHLRSEYIYDWNRDDVKIQFVDPETKKVYEAKYQSLADLFSSPDIVLLPPTTATP